MNNEAINQANAGKIPARIERFRFPKSQHANGDRSDNVVAAAGFRSLSCLETSHSPTEEKIEIARTEGFRNGQAAAHAQFEADFHQRQEAISLAVDKFEQERIRYFRQIEKELVALSISIAKRILHRESQIDPLVLQGAVRAILDRISSDSKCSLRLNPSQMIFWQAWFDSQPGRPRPELVADSSLSPDHCVLETSMGTTDISIDGQLKEIESGFCDLLSAGIDTK